MSGQRGAALLVVLWVLALLGTLLAGVASLVHVQNRQALWQSQHTRALVIAEAGVALAVEALTRRDLRARWRPDGREQFQRFDDSELQISVRSERGKLDLNSALSGDFARLFQACAAGPGPAKALARQLDRRRAESTPLRMLEELRELPGMTQALYQCTLPYVTVWSGEDRPLPDLAAPLLAHALNMPPARGLPTDGGQTFSISSRARLPGGHDATLQVTLMLNPPKEGARPYRVLRWQE
ncbi:general secretion pathway protein GspK [Pseudomonas sp. v388]|uniref:type II secretion system protein GspK n=1 Tax=Pseudomonas sp. v388 TaxID=2479849 RepID=UPI000F7BAE53|nr:type II secretion system protein GspK [Pseudomonas sp. v388]RRV10684.1 general secretion pathway protein GspK [Pseudomonas sp. v388]